MEKRKITLIAGAIVMGIIGLIFSIILGIYFISDKPGGKSNLDNPIEAPETPPDDFYVNDVKIPLDDIESQFEAIEGDLGAMLTEADAGKIYIKVKDLIEDGEFKKALDVFEREISRYKISESPSTFKKLDNMQRDLSKMAQLLYTLDNGEVEISLDIINSLENPDNHLLSTLMLDRTMREEIIRSEDSLNPIFDGDITIKGIDYYPEYEENTVYDILEVAQVKFIIEKNLMYADYLYTTNGLLLYKIREAEEGATSYMTIKKWREILNPTKETEENPIEIEEVNDEENN